MKRISAVQPHRQTISGEFKSSARESALDTAVNLHFAYAARIVLVTRRGGKHGENDWLGQSEVDA